MQYDKPQDIYVQKSKGFRNKDKHGFVKVFHRSVLFPIVPIGSYQYNKFIEFMRSLSSTPKPFDVETQKRIGRPKKGQQ